MMCQFYELLEMVCSIIFVLGLVKCVHLGTLIIINFMEIDSLKKGGDCDNENKE